MLEYIAAYYDNNRDAQELIARLNYLEHCATSAHNIAASIAGGVAGLTVMVRAIDFFEPKYGIASYCVFLALTASVIYCAYRIMLSLFQQVISTDPYLTKDFEIRRIKSILDEQVDEIVRMHLQLSFQNAVKFKDATIQQ